MRRAWNQVTVDGLNGNELSGTSRFSSAINLDAIAEVKVLLNTYKAEFGRTGGANIEIVSKSGGTNYRGSAYWYGRRDKWNSNSVGGQPRQHAESQAPHRHLRLQSRRPGRDPGAHRAGRREEAVLLLFAGGAAGAAAGAGASVPRPDRARARAAISRSRSTRLAAPSPSWIRSRASRSPTTSSRPTASIPTRRRLLNMLPLPNRPGENFTYNFSRQETSENPRMNNVLRVDGRPSKQRHGLGDGPDVHVEPVRLGNHRRAGALGLLQRRVPLRRQLDQRRLEPRVPFAAGQRIPERRAHADRRLPDEGRRRLDARSAAATSAGRWASSIGR